MAPAEASSIAPPWMVLEATRKEAMPKPRSASRQRLHTPEHEAQVMLRTPGWNALRKAFDAERIRLETSVGSDDPELVVVIEVAQSADAFLEKVENIEGLEFLFENAEERLPDDDFHLLKKLKGADEYRRTGSESLKSTVYFVFTDAAAVKQLLSLWEKFRADPSVRLPQPWKKVFTQQVEDVRAWAPQDRLTQSLKTALEDAEVEGIKQISVEVELWYRRDRKARDEAGQRVRGQAEMCGGDVISECVIEDIDYHAFLIELPVEEVKDFYSEDPTGLVSAKQVMHLHRNTQASVRRLDVDGESPAITRDASLPTKSPRIALLDGLPMSNHGLLVDRLIVDDPDEREQSYPVQHRRHGTAMASAIIHGDLSEARDALQHRLYVHPILEAPDRHDDPERYSATGLICDVLHRAIASLCEGEGTSPLGPTAPSVKIVNLSIGDPDRLLARRMSPLARLVDYLADRYDLLFVVSAGNHPQPVSYEPQTGDLSTDLWKSRVGDLIDRRLLSPAESINALTVGALNSDMSGTVVDAVNLVEPVEFDSPALYSAVGRGFARSVKPEVFAPGGRQVYRDIDGEQPLRTLRPVENLVRGPGVLVAQPGLAGSTASAHYWRGTSVAAAHVTRYAADVLDRLELLQAEGGAVPGESLAVLTKALVVHSASWGKSMDWEADAGLSGTARRNGLSRLLGYGCVSPSWLFEDAPHRATLVATDALDPDEQAFFEVPLPEGLRSSTHWRRLRFTLAWFSPINPRHQAYRRARLALEIPQTSRELLEVERAEVHRPAAVRGTVQHELLEGTNAPLFDSADRFEVSVTAQPGAGAFEDPIRFGLAVTLETATEADIAVREQMRQRVRMRR
ncbi:MAG: S8 family peptidase [Acidimicrobiaceae bacterium]|nr:S8 family peptidase [Acidimicrobiaceae bacterium]